MQITNYSDKCFVITGEDTREYKEQIKSLGGKWNARLKNDLKGWVFPIQKLSQVKQFVENPSSFQIIESDDMTDKQKIENLTQRVKALEEIVSEFIKKNN